MIHNVKDENLIKIQDSCHVAEQSLRHSHPVDALNALYVIRDINEGLIKVVEKIIEEEKSNG